MKLNMFPSGKKVLTLLVLTLLTLGLGAWNKLSAERDAASALLPDNQVYPITAMTWDEWVAYDSPNRKGFNRSYHIGNGFPNVSRWLPEDILPAERFDGPRRSVCELPERTRRVLRASSDPLIDIYELQDLAKQGYAEAQASLGSNCSVYRRQYVTNDQPYDDGSIGVKELAADKRPVSVPEALYWAERGAASGNAEAQWGLAQCMHQIYLDQSSYPDAVTDPIELDPFWYDKVFFWLNQAMQNGLVSQAVTQRSAPQWFRAPAFSARDEIDNYKWKRLWQLQANFRRFLQNGFSQDDFDIRSKAFGVYEGSVPYSDAVIAQAEKEVGEWLRTYPDVWHNIYANTYVGTQMRRSRIRLCPGEPGHYEIFDFIGLKKALAHYDVNWDIPAKPLPKPLPKP